MNIGYARVSTSEQNIESQIEALLNLGVEEENIYIDHGISGTSKDNRPALAQALAAVRKGDTLVTTKLDRLARSVPDAREIADELHEKGVLLSFSGQTYDPTDPFGQLFFNLLSLIAEFEKDLLSKRTKEGMAIAKAKGRLRGKQPKLSSKQQTELAKMHESGNYTIVDLAEIFAVSRPTIYRTLDRIRQQSS